MTVSADLRRAVFERDGGRCRYCEARAVHIDHIICKALRRRHRLPDDDPAMLVAACFSCNMRRGTQRLVPPGFDTSGLPGPGWREWRGETRQARTVCGRCHRIVGGFPACVCVQ